ncbi:hypothetical protein OEZ86_009602 [Tetradesmus obliquus]|uniref:UDP-glycosyltransferases domain-containing protein n=1 Tax=Tetradesmus obliquus TaxID=3088 RepID=A0ABY8UST5_TETOB|nr:hypothetical protein OEZ85_001046 [Tetradesmus obliquus]WIA43077.1 hypothetical protein OEZ86_009602 [Tetradesmus obliquus]
MTKALAAAAAAAAAGSPPSQHFMFVSNLGRSHMVPYLEVLQPLAERGHKVTVVTDSDASAWLAPNYPGVEIQFVPKKVNEIMHHMRSGNSSMAKDMMDPNRRGFATIINHFTIPTYPIMSSFLRGVFSSSTPDLLICDFLVDACADVADTLGMKYAVSISSIPPGVQDAPYLNSWFSPYPHTTSLHLNLWQRFVNSFVVPAQIIASSRQPIQRLNKVKRECGVKVYEGNPMARHSHALKIVNSFFGFESPRPVSPLVQMIGPIRSHVNSSMPADIQHWLDKLAANSSSSSRAQPRVVYVAFGTHVDPPVAMLQHLSNALLAVLDAGYADGVIWAVSNIRREKFPAAIEQHPRVLLLPFAPQRALLAHPAVSLFVSHGGAESSHEAMYDGVPILILSFFGDQPMNGAKLQEAGMAEAIRQNLLTADNAKELLFHMLNPATAEPYRAAARKMQALVRALDQTNTAAAGDMFEFFAQYGWGHLVSAGDKMPWYKASNLDLYAAVSAAVLLALAAVVMVLRRVVAVMIRMVRGSSSGSDGQKCARGLTARAAYDIKAKAA